MIFLGSKTIETERLVLHKTEEKDLKILWEILSLEEVSKYYLTAKINTDWEKEKVWQMKKLQNASNPDTFIWTIELKDAKVVIGQVSFHKTEKDNIMDIGWFLDPTYQKKGYAFEAAKAAIHYMFSECGLEKIETCVCLKNPNSFRLMEKLGFRRQKTTRMVKYTLLEKEEEDVEYHLTKEEFMRQFEKEKSDNMDRYQSAKTTGILGMLGNIFLLIIKAIAGVISHSQSLLADAFNSAGDIFSSCMTFIGNKISSKEADEDHHLGHGKAEYIYSMLISISMFVLSCTMIKNVWVHLVKREYIVYSHWLIVVCVITIVTKLGLYLYTTHLYKKSHNILILANSKDHRNDVAITTLTLLSVTISNKFVYLDSIIGIIISLWIAFTAIKLFIESYDVLMDKSMDTETKEKVLRIINNHKEIIKINHFNSTPVGYRYQISFTIFVDGNLSTFESHDIANSLEREIERDIPEIYLTVIHVNPVHIEAEKLEKKRKI